MNRIFSDFNAIAEGEADAVSFADGHMHWTMPLIFLKITTTMNIYADVTKELKKSEFEGLDAFFKTGRKIEDDES